MRLWLLFAVLALVFSETEQACPQSTDPCTVAPCPCAGFTVVRIQTNSQNAKTTVVINATNYCTGGVYYVNFGLTDGKTTLDADLVGGGTAFNSQYAWTVNPTYSTSSPTRTWIQFANNGGGANSKMQKGSGSSQWDLFTFEVSNYNPTFGWYFQMHYGSAWDTYGPLDMSLCQCTNCDAGFSQRTIQPCVVGYADPTTGVYSGSTNRAFSVFNENQVLYSYAMYNNLLALFYSDEYPMTLGIQTITNSLTKETRTYPFSNGTQSPVCITGSNIKFGQVGSFDGLDPWSAIDGNGPANGCNELAPPVVGKTCGRPMTPLMFISDITTQKNNISGDWQMYGNGVLPAKVCGLWQASVKTVTGKNADGTYAFSVVPVTTAIPPGNQNPVGSGLPFWNLGTGSDPPPIGFVNPSAVGAVPYLNTYGTEVAWDLDTLGLISTHSYRFQFLVHDGDSTKVGGDVGQACLITTQACPAGFSGTACDKCDTNPLPNDGSWTWFCSNTGSNPPYNLLKLPTSKVNAAPYKGNGFIPSLNFNDTQGYIVGCNCVRKTFTCPQACCGNGACQDQNGTCKCATAPAGTNLTTCCLPPPPPPPPPTCVANVSTIPGVNCTTCISNSFGLSCSWCAKPGVQAWTSAALVNGTCGAPKTCTGTEFTTCNLPPPPPPPPTCVANLTQAKGTNCTTCVSNIYGLTCSWCPQINQSLWLQSALQNGTCQAVGTCAGVELKTCALQPPPPPPVAPPVTPPTAVPQYVPVCSDMTNPVYGGNQSCGSCISNVRGLQCAWCATDLSVQPPNRTLVEGNCTTISGTCKSPLLFACVAPPPPPPPPPKPTCENVTVGPNFNEVNCSVCLGNPYGLTCVWCSDAGTTGLAILQNGTCMTNASTCPNAVSLTCDLPPPPPPPMTCENVSQIPGINCSTCISNIYSLQCAWCAEPANKSNGTCGAYGSCGANVELYACNTPCYNDGNYCSGHGSCVNETCVCDPQTGTGLGYTGPACNITVYPPPLTCANLTGVYNCSDCFAQSAIIGVRCAWCPNTTDPLRILTSGQCIEDYICGNSSYYSCTPPSIFVPPECADNCSNHGMCVNISVCKQIQSMDQGALIVHTKDDKGNDVTQIYTCDSANLNETLQNNQTSLCACLDPYTGINCGVVGAGVNIKLAAGIAAGIIAAIVVLGILGLALCGGGAAAAASAVAAAPAAGVDMNPLYVGNDLNADNPLYA